MALSVSILPWSFYALQPVGVLKETGMFDLLGVFGSQFLYNLRTGDPFQDAVVTFVLGSLLTWLSKSLSLTNYTCYLKSWWQSDKQSQITIPQFQRSQSAPDFGVYTQVNTLYFAVMWYINRQLEEPPRLSRAYYQPPTRTGSVVHADKALFAFEGTLSFRYRGAVIFATDIFVYKSLPNTGEYEEHTCILRSLESSQFLNEFVLECFDQFNLFKLSKGKRSIYVKSDPKITGSSWQPELCKSQGMPFEAIILKKGLQYQVKKDVERFLSSEEEYLRHGWSWKRNYLFYGKPGCGKTSLIKAIVQLTEYDVYWFNMNDYSSDEEFAEALRQVPPRSLLVFEDFDCMNNRTDNRTATLQKVNSIEGSEVVLVGKRGVSLSCLLNVFDGIRSAEGSITILTTNFIDRLDSALVRDGRMDYKLELDHCDHEQLIGILEYFYGPLDSEHREALMSLKAEKVCQFSPAAVTSVVRRNTCLSDSVAAFLSM